MAKIKNNRLYSIHGEYIEAVIGNTYILDTAGQTKNVLRARNLY